MEYKQHLASVKARLVTSEKSLIVAALKRAKGNRAQAARDLGISRQYLYVRLAEFGIRFPARSVEVRKKIATRAARARWAKSKPES